MAEEPATNPAETAKPKPTGWQRVRSILVEGVIIVVGAIIISTLLRTFVAQMFVIPSGSMENTLLVGDRVLVTKFGDFERGDVVVFADPGNWLPDNNTETNPVRQGFEFLGILPNSSTEHLIKRVIGMPGDNVKCCSPSGALMVNGQSLNETSYLYSENGTQVAPSAFPFEVVVPEGHIFVMGDHRNQSNDSRCRLTTVSQNGPPGQAAFVPVENVVGATVAIVAPLDRIASFKIPETYQSVPDPSEPAPDVGEIVESATC